MKQIIPLSCCFLLLISISSYAEVITDGSLGAVTQLSGQMEIPQSLGTTQGNNLFHSFNRFTINTGESVTFTGDAALKNIISRVTGGQASYIDGVLKSTIGNANFYFINPAGITFGANATIDVPAAFHVSTADTLRFSDGNQFNAIEPTASTLSIAEPTGFGFLTNQTGHIEFQGSALTFKEGSAVSLSAKQVNLNKASLQNPSGSFQVSAVGNSTTYVPLNGTSSTPLTGTLSLNESRLDASGDSGGRIYLQGGDIQLDNASSVTSDTLGTGLAQGISIQGQTLSVAKQSKISSSTGISGNAGNIDIKVNDIFITSAGKISSDNVNGIGGDITLTAKQFTLTEGGSVSTTTFGAGNAGKIIIPNADNVLIDGVDDTIITRFTDTLSFKGFYSGFYLNTYGAGNGGNLLLNSKNLTVRNGGVISAVAVDIADPPRNTANTFAGNITINANTVNLQSGGIIGANSSSAANAGSVIVNATDSVTVSGQFNRAAHPTVTIPHGIDFSAILSSSGRTLYANAPTLGAGGNVTINSKSVSLSNGGLVSVSSEGDKDAGDININFANQLLLDLAFITTTANQGNGGDIHIQGGQLIYLKNSGFLTSVTGSTGNGGNIDLKADHLIMDTGVIEANAIGGSGGNIDLNLQALIPSHNSLITGESQVIWQPFIPGLNVIQAASETGVSGTINVTSPQFDISASISGLDVAQLELPQISYNPCQNSQITSSTLARGSKGGIPPDETQYGFIPPAKSLNSNNIIKPVSPSNKVSKPSYPCSSL